MNPKIVPTISSGISGPLGVLHLPRLWQKTSLALAGKLHPDYPGCGKGYDSMTLEALGIQEADYLTFMQTRPTYIQLETWIKNYPAVRLTTADIYKHNQAITGYIHKDATRASILKTIGLPDDGSVNPGAVDLNNLDDWHTFWATELAAVD
jgi:hypothetical protein